MLELLQTECSRAKNEVSSGHVFAFEHFVENADYLIQLTSQTKSSSVAQMAAQCCTSQVSFRGEFLVIASSIFVSDLLPKTILLATFCCMCLASTNLTQLALKRNVFSVLTQSNGHYTSQGHSKSLILAPMEARV